MGWKKTTPKTKTSSTGKVWLGRALIAIVAGFGVGMLTGVVGVNKLEPGTPGQTDSLALVQETARQFEEANDPIRIRRAADSAAAAERMQRAADSTRVANDPNSPEVPNVVGLEEGAAREALELAGLEVGSIRFEGSSAAAGIVLSTSPKSKLKVRMRTPVDMVLSDGRPPDDTIPSPDFRTP